MYQGTMLLGCVVGVFIYTDMKGKCVITYLLQKAVAEVSNHKEPIGRSCGIQLVRKPIDFKCFEF